CATDTDVARAPDEGLHLYLGKEPRTPASPLNLNDVGRSLELRVVSGNITRTIGLSNIASPRYPAFPPVLWWGSFWPDDKFYETMPFHGEASFIIQRLDLRPGAIQPRTLPSRAGWH